MSAWPGAHAGFGVDGAAPHLTPAGGGGMHPRPIDRAVRLDSPMGAVERWRFAVEVHAHAFDAPRWRSLLHLATSGRLIVFGGAICSLGRVPSSRIGRLSLAVLVALVAVPALAISIGPATLSPHGRLLWFAVTAIPTVAAMVASARLFAVSRRWGRDRSDGVELTNLASARSGHGDAGRLLDVVLDHADKRGHCLLLRVQPTNRAALHLYRSRDFTDLPCHELTGELWMERAATPAPAVPRLTLGGFTMLAAPMVAVAATLAAGRTVFLLVVTAGALCALSAAALIDRRSGRLPNSLVACAAMFGTMACDAADTGIAAIFGASVAAAPLLVMHLVDPAALGFGDVKFAAAAGILVAAQYWPAAVGVPLVSLVIAVACRLASGHRARPFGPALLVGTAAAIAAVSFVPLTELAR